MADTRTAAVTAALLEKAADAHCHAHIQSATAAASLPPRAPQTPPPSLPVARALCATSRADWPAVRDFERESGRCGTVRHLGVHPWWARKEAPDEVRAPRRENATASSACANLEGLEATGALSSKHRRVVDSVASALRVELESDPSLAVGEIGLHCVPKSPHNGCLHEALFEAQLNLAVELVRPANVHCVRAGVKILHALRRARSRFPRATAQASPIVVHAFQGPVECVQDLAAEGCFFSMNGGFLARLVDGAAVVRAIPMDRMLVESDGESDDGCAKAMAASVAYVSEVLDLDPAEVVDVTTSNFTRVYGGVSVA